MKDEATLLLEMYQVQVSRSEHYENLRSSATNLIITLATGLVAVVTFDGDISRGDAWAGGGLLVLGLFGYGVAYLHSQRANRHGKRAAEYRHALDRMFPDAKIDEIRNRVPKRQTHLNRIWSWFHLGIAVLGVVIIGLASSGAAR